MIRPLAALCCAAALLLLPPAAARADDERSPFTAVQWRDGADGPPRVRVDGRWYELAAIDGVPIADIVDHCRGSYGDKWDKRFAEDLILVFADMGRRLGPAVDLVVIDDAGKRVELGDVPATEDNRNAVWRARRVNRVDRAHAPGVPDDLRDLVRSVAPGGDDSSELSPREVRDDLDQLEWLLTNTYSYETLTGFDYRRALDAIRADIGEDDVTARDLAGRIVKLLARFGDGHTRVDGSSDWLGAERLPIRFARVDGRIIAHGRGLRDPLVAIGGVPAAQLLDAARLFSPDGSPQMRDQLARWRLRGIDVIHRQLGRDPLPDPAITVRRPGVADPLVLHPEDLARIGGDEPRADPDPPVSQRIRDDGVGVLRIATMGLRAGQLDQLRGAMDALRDARALVIDVRDNGGGRRDALRALYPYFMDPGEPPAVVNTARYRLHPGEVNDHVDGHLDNRFLYPRDWTGWSDAERAAIDAFARGFEPAWTPTRGRFSSWHYMVISPPDGESRVFHYDKPCAILLDAGCYSATDIFLGAFAARDDVILVGRASGGGSGRSRPTRLLHSGIVARISSMVSHRPSGALYDGIGVEPDVHVPLTLDELLDKRDVTLETAIEHLLAD